MIRSVLAVAAGFAATSMLVVLGTVLAASLAGIPTSAGAGAPAPLYLAANVVASLLAAVVGGWVAATIARERPLLHGAALAGVMLVLGIVGLAMPRPAGQPAWYPWVLLVVGPLGALAGARLRSARPAGIAAPKG